MSFLSSVFPSFDTPDLPPTEEGSAEDSKRQRDQRGRQTGTPNADWPVQRRYYDRVMNRMIGEPVPPSED